MARLGCICGAEMTNTEAPSKNRLNIFYLKEAEAAIEKNSQIRLWDFYTGWDEKNECKNSFQNREEPVEYWYCPKCKRVYEVQAKSLGRIVRAFAVENKNIANERPAQEKEELIVLFDTEMDELLTNNEMMTLAEYLKTNRAERFYISADANLVYVVKNDQGISRVYKRER